MMDIIALLAGFFSTKGKKTEHLTPLKNWMAIKKGDIIYSRKSLMPRKVLESKNGGVVLRKMKQSCYPKETTTYVPCDRHFFIVKKTVD